MSAATVTMTPQEARKFRKDYDAEATRLSRMSAAALRTELRERGVTYLHGGPSSKYEIAGELLRQGYPTRRFNEAVHILHHDVVWPDCPHCTGEVA